MRFGSVLLLCSTALLGSVGCRDVVEDASSSDAPIQRTTMALPEGIWIRPTNLEHYRLFASQADAETWFQTWSATLGEPAGLGGPLVPYGDPRYAVVESKLAVVWRSFTDLLPRDTTGLDQPPRVILVDRADVNAYATLDPSMSCVEGAPPPCLPHAIIVHTAAVSSASTPSLPGDILEGLIAHELGHHVLKHGLPGNGDRIAKYYDARTGPTFGFQAADDPAMRKLAGSWLALAQIAGSAPLEELHGLPLAAFSPPVFGRILRPMRTKARSVNPAACDAANAAAGVVSSVFSSSVDLAITEGPVLDAPKRAALDAAATDFVTKMTACAEGMGATLVSLVAETTGASEAQILQSFSAPDERALLQSTANPFEAMIMLTLARHAAERKIDLTPVRIYTYEEQADDVAVNVLFRAGRDPRSLSSFLGFSLDADQRARCDDVRAHGEVPFGAIDEPHHAACYRIDHATKLTRFLSE